MDTSQENPRTSLLKRIVRWIGDFEQAIAMRPVDHLARRVADLERRIAAVDDLRSHSARDN